jgi:hypothetical protein
VHPRLRGIGRGLPGLEKKVVPLTFGDQLAQAEKEVGEIAAVQEEGTSSTWGSQENLAEQAPSAAIMASWIEIEKIIERLATQHDLGAKVRIGNPYGTYKLLAERRIVPGSILPALSDLRGLRNAVAHGVHEPTPGEAYAYTSMARKVGNILEGISGIEGSDESDFA